MDNGEHVSPEYRNRSFFRETARKGEGIFIITKRAARKGAEKDVRKRLILKQTTEFQSSCL